MSYLLSYYGISSLCISYVEFLFSDYVYWFIVLLIAVLLIAGPIIIYVVFYSV